MRTLRWMIVLAALGAIAYLVVAVDIGGRTLLDRITGQGEPAAPAGAPAAPDERPRGQPATAAQKQAPPEKASDALTDEDRADLTRLIERLDEDPGDARAADGGPPPAKVP